LGNAILGSPAVQLVAFSNVGFPHAFDLVIVGTRNSGGASTTNNKIYGLNGNTGAIVWTFSPGNMDIVSSSPVIDYNSNSVWVASRSGAVFTQPSLWKLSTATVNPAGSLLNSVTLSSLAVSNVRDIDMSPDFDLTTQYLFAVTLGGTLVAVDHATPANVFTQAGAGSGMGFPTIFAGGAANEDDIYYSTSGAAGGVHKRTFNRVTHLFTTRWDDSVTLLTGGAAGTISAPVLITPTPTAAMYVGTSDGRLKSLNLSTGAILLSRNVNLGVIIGDPSLDVISGKIYVGDASGRIYSFDVF
jgi:outer membrane protein assembly factor BamB